MGVDVHGGPAANGARFDSARAERGGTAADDRKAVFATRIRHRDAAAAAAAHVCAAAAAPFFAAAAAVILAVERCLDRRV